VTLHGPLRVTRLVQTIGGTFSCELGIHLARRKPSEIFKWFLASIFFGARISKTIAVRTYREFENEGLVDPRKIVLRGWNGLTVVLDRGGYVRYDFKTATKLLDVSRALLEEYGGNLNRLHAIASDPRDVERRLKALGKGIGDVTVDIFLRELRGIWPKAEPLPSDRVLTAAKNLGLIPEAKADRRDALQLLKEKWREQGNSPKGFADFEAALVRWGLALRRQSRSQNADKRVTHRKSPALFGPASHCGSLSLNAIGPMDVSFTTEPPGRTALEK
jgi:hypothetical protein